MTTILVPHHGREALIVDTAARAIRGSVVELTNGFALRPFDAARGGLGYAAEGRYATQADAFGAYLAELAPAARQAAPAYFIPAN